MTRAELKSTAKEQIKGNIGKIFIMILIIVAISFACTFIPFIGGIASFIITPAFTLSLTMIFLKLSKSEEIAVGNLFDGFNKTGRALWMNILISIYTFLWSLLFIIPGIVKSFAYSMSYYVLADNPELTANEAISKSKNLMNGHKGDLFVLYFSFFWWYLLVGLTFGIAAIYVSPYMNATVANFYNSIKDAEKVVDAQPAVQA